MNNRLSPQVIKQIEREFDLKREAVELLDIIAAEFKSDPQSVQCFDKRIVDRAIAVSEELRDWRRT